MCARVGAREAVFTRALQLSRLSEQNCKVQDSISNVMNVTLAEVEMSAHMVPRTGSLRLMRHTKRKCRETVELVQACSLHASMG